MTEMSAVKLELQSHWEAEVEVVVWRERESVGGKIWVFFEDLVVEESGVMEDLQNFWFKDEEALLEDLSSFFIFYLKHFY